MLKSDAVSHFGNESKVADALGCTRQAINKWDVLIPLKTALRLQAITRGKLRVKLALYKDAA